MYTQIGNAQQLNLCGCSLNRQREYIDSSTSIKIESNLIRNVFKVCTVLAPSPPPQIEMYMSPLYLMDAGISVLLAMQNIWTNLYRLFGEQWGTDPYSLNQSESSSRSKIDRKPFKQSGELNEQINFRVITIIIFTDGVNRAYWDRSQTHRSHCVRVGIDFRSDIFLWRREKCKWAVFWCDQVP